jgi:hypothetical protein
MYNSPLIDAGTNTLLIADVLGNPRALDGNNNRHVRTDIGAYEYVNPRADSDGNGILDRDELPRKGEAVYFERPAE